MNKLSERKTMTLNLPAAEMDVLEGLAGEQELTKTQIMRQALKLYQLVTVKARDGHHMMFSGEPPMAAAHVVGVGLPLLDAARSEALSSPGVGGGKGEEVCRLIAGPSDPGAYAGDMFFGDPEDTTKPTHCWSGRVWERL